jgi:hypothetical protein
MKQVWCNEIANQKEAEAGNYEPVRKEARGQVFHYHIRQIFKAAAWQNGIAAMLNRAAPLDCKRSAGSGLTFQHFMLHFADG